MATRQRVQLQHLIGREVLDSRGKRAGRIEEVVAIQTADGCLLQAYLLGERGLMRRLAMPQLFTSILSPLGIHNRPTGQRVPWDQMDLSDPKHPRLRCSVEELKDAGPRDNEDSSEK